MPARLIDTRFTVPSKGAIRITLPKGEVFRNMWNAEQERIAVCILDDDGRVVLHPVYRVLGKGILSPEDEEKVKEACIEQSKRTIAEKYTQAVKKVVEKGDTVTYHEELRKLKRLIEELFSQDVFNLKGIKIPTGRDLRFASTDRIAEVAMAILLDVWQLEEEDFSFLVEEVNRIKEEFVTFTGLLEKLNALVRSGKIPEKEAETIGAFLKYRIRMLKNRLDRIAQLAVC